MTPWPEIADPPEDVSVQWNQHAAGSMGRRHGRHQGQPEGRPDKLKDAFQLVGFKDRAQLRVGARAGGTYIVVEAVSFLEQKETFVTYHLQVYHMLAGQCMALRDRQKQGFAEELAAYHVGIAHRQAGHHDVKIA